MFQFTIIVIAGTPTSQGSPEKVRTKMIYVLPKKRKTFFNIGQYFLVFWEKMVSIWSVFWEKVVSILVSLLTFLFTDHSCYHWMCSTPTSGGEPSVFRHATVLTS
jgi:hypothetical protein